MPTVTVEYTDNLYDALCAHRIITEDDALILLLPTELLAKATSLRNERQKAKQRKRKRNRRKRVRIPPSQSHKLKQRVRIILHIHGNFFRKSRPVVPTTRTVTKSRFRSRKSCSSTTRRSEKRTHCDQSVHVFYVVTSRVGRNLRTVSWFQLRNLLTANRTGSAQGGPSPTFRNIYPG